MISIVDLSLIIIYSELIYLIDHRGRYIRCRSTGKCLETIFKIHICMNLTKFEMSLFWLEFDYEEGGG